MARTPHNCAQSGSEKWLQLAVNKHPEHFCALIAKKLNPKPSVIDIYSPLKCDQYAEYSDQDFINTLDLELAVRPLDEFWPSGGPHWDGLATTDRSQVLLFEAKAYASELKGRKRRATSIKSKRMIDRSLRKTQQYLGADMCVDWAKSPYYQYANRLAHLYLLFVLNGIDAYLLMVYFLNDDDKGGPDSPQLWEHAIKRQYAEMGLSLDHCLSNRIVKLYMNVCDLEDEAGPAREETEL